MATQGGSIRPLVAGNWKMNGTRAMLAQFDKLSTGLSGASAAPCDVMICPPATLVSAAVERAKGSGVRVGGQDCHAKASGAHTGDISAEMLADAGAQAVIVGHSERRTDHAESDVIVRAKCEAAWRAGLIAIVCIGESEAERRSGVTLDVVSGQLAGSLPGGCLAARTVIAYEPIWAIGTGLTPTVGDVAEVHAAVRRTLADRFGAEGSAMRILYGGSVKPSNARELLRVADVNGALVGGASLEAADFLGIIDAYR
jgi:triosephosphate isomerase (TIM)